jgi:hypothetical protein
VYGSHVSLTRICIGLQVEQYFGYFPSLALAGTATGLYYAAALIVTAQLIYKRNRNAWFMLLVVLTALAEAGGYVAMIWMVKNSGQASLFSAYVAMQCLIVLSPNVLQAASYTTVGKISTIAKMHTKSKFLKPKAISWGFVGLDLFALIVQAVGISIWATQKSSGDPVVSTVKLGSWITVAGLGLQLVSFCLFTLLAVWIQRHKDNKFRGYKAHKWLFLGVYGVIFFITIRNVFRFVEFTQSAVKYPDPGGLTENQTLFYALETLPILLAFAVFIVLSPIFLLPTTPLHDYIPDETDEDAMEKAGKEFSLATETEEFETVKLAA